MKDIIIKDKKEFDRKIEKLKKDGAGKLHIVSDFDNTLTKAFFEGKKIATSYSCIRAGGYLSEEYSKKAYALFDKYHPYEINNNLSMDDKIIKMNVFV